MHNPHAHDAQALSNKAHHADTTGDNVVGPTEKSGSNALQNDAHCRSVGSHAERVPLQKSNREVHMLGIPQWQECSSMVDTAQQPWQSTASDSVREHYAQVKGLSSYAST